MKSKLYWEMNPKELAEATKPFDEPLVVGQARALSPEEREKWKSVKRKKVRPKVGQGFKRVSVSLELGLLTRVTALAKKSRISRSAMVANALEQALAEKE
jgi:hypothetical protein